MDKKGLMVFLATLFIVGYAVQLGSLYYGWLEFVEPNFFQVILFVVVMFVPAFSAVVGMLAEGTPEEGDEAGGELGFKLWPIPAGSAVSVTLLVFGAIALSYVLAGVLGYLEPQWRMLTLKYQLDQILTEPLEPDVVDMLPMIAFVVVLPGSIVLGMTVYAVLAAGNEVGWRGFLQPRLMGLGRVPAYVITGMVWFLWTLPILCGIYYTGDLGSTYFWGALLRVLIVFVLLSVILGEFRRRSDSVSVAAIGLGVFTAQINASMWDWLFPVRNDPWSGPYGVFAIVLFALLAFVCLRYGRRARGGG